LTAPLHSSASPELRSLVAAALTLLVSCACRSPLGGRELDLVLSAQGLPGVGAGLALAQRVLERGPRHLDFELGLERQELRRRGPRGDDWTRAWAGLRWAAGEAREHLEGRAGVTWLRSEGAHGDLEQPGDFGGAYIGAGWVWELAPALAMGPELVLLFVDAEGDDAGAGWLGQLAWRWIWHL
jgi:hypothetical protein